MVDTRQKIIDTALALFNKQGYTSVSMRDISNALGISPGNLTYHFPRKIQIIEAVIDYNKIKVVTSMPPDGANSLEELYDAMQKLYALQHEEHFYFAHLLEIARDIPGIYEKQQTVRQVIFVYFKNSFVNFRKNRIFIDTFDDSVYENLAFVLLYLACFWHLDFSMSKDKYLHNVNFFDVFSQTMIAYLTVEGKESLTNVKKM